MSAPTLETSAPNLPWDDELRRAEAATLRRLLKLTEVDDPRVALRACETVVKAVAGARRAQAAAQPKPPARAVPEPAPARQEVREPRGPSAPVPPAPVPPAPNRRAAAVLTSVLRTRPPTG